MQTKRTCFSCFHVEKIKDRKDKCYCLFGHESVEDAELIYEPIMGNCPSWKSVVQEIEDYNRKVSENEHKTDLR